MTAGSGLFVSEHANKEHLLRGTGGLGPEIADVRADVARTLLPMAAITVEEYMNPATEAVAGLEAATATTVAPRSVTTFLAGGVAALLAYGRNVTFTTAGATPANAPASALVTGTGMDGAALTETVVLAQTAATAAGVKIFKTVTDVDYAAADGTAATVSIGFGALLGMSKTIKSRGGLQKPIREIAVGAVVTSGVFDVPNLSYAPAAAPNGTNDYALYYEYTL